MEFLHLLAGIRNDFLTLVFTGFTELAGEAVLLVLLAAVYWCINKKTAYRLGFAYMASSLTINNLKVIFRIPRPWKLDPKFKPVESAVGGATGYSFPSGHTCAATSMYGTLGLSIKKLWLRIVFAIVIVGVIFSRMYLGVHTPLDVSVSFCITAAITVICFIISSKIEMTKKNKLVLCSLFGLYAIGSLVLSLVLNAVGLVDIANAADSCKTAGAALGFVIGWYVETEYINFEVKTDKFFMQIVKIIIGAAVLLAIKEGTKLLFKGVFGVTAIVDGVEGVYEPLALAGVRYFLMVLWAIGIYPLIIKKFFGTKKA